MGKKFKNQGKDKKYSGNIPQGSQQSTGENLHTPEHHNLNEPQGKKPNKFQGGNKNWNK